MVEITSAPTVEPEALPGRAYPRLPDESNPAASGVGFGKDIEQAADVLQTVHDKVQAQARQTQLADAHNQLQALSLGLTHDPTNGAFTKEGKNAFGLDQQYLPQYDQGAAQIASGIADPKARAAFTAQVIPQMRNQLSEQLDTHELTQHKAYSDQTAQASIELAATAAAANHNNPAVMADNKDTILYNINQLAQSKGWSDEQTQFHTQKALTDFHSTIIDSMVDQGQLSQARTYLYQQTAAGEIDPKAADGLQRMMLAKQEHDVMMNDKIQRDASNAVLKNGILLSQSGQLTPQFIEKYHNTLEPQAYEYMYNLLSGKGATTDPRVYAPLLQEAMSGKDVNAQAQEALYSGKISKEDYKAIVEKSDQPRKGYVSRGIDYIKQALTPNPMIPDPDGHRSLANATDDWNQWVNDHPDATDEQARTSYRSITDHYQIVASDKATLFNAVPLHLVGSRTAPDVPATWAATKAAHDSGDMSDAEFHRQAALILQWQAAQKKPAPAKSAP
jgi:hypothetical protein